MKRAKFYQLIIGILATMNIVTLVFFLSSQPQYKGDLSLSDHLALTGKAKTEVKQLEQEHHKQKRKLIGLDQKLHRKLFEFVGSEDSHESTLRKLNENKKEIERMTFNFFDQVAAYCNKNQKIKLRKLIFKHLSALHPKGRSKKHPKR
jgi:hypothetical protein